MRIEPYLAAAIVFLIGCTSSRADDLTKKVWMRTDGQRITGNAKLEQQDRTDRAACLATAPPSQSPETFNGCMTAKGYVLIAARDAEERSAAARAAIQKQTKPRRQKTRQKTKSTSDDQIERDELNEANRRLLALNEKDRRSMFYITIIMAGQTCSEVARTFYKGSAKPSSNAVWNVECKNGSSYSILVMPDEKGSTKVMTCDEFRAAGGGECFVPGAN
jgi:hypothetical protein